MFGLLLCALAFQVADLANWPQFRGPSGAGVAADQATPPVQFGPGKNLLWSADSGVGHGSPCIWGNGLFFLSYNPADKTLETVALDRFTGTRLWRQVLVPKEIEKVHAVSNPATATPATDGDRVYVYFGSYGLAAYTLDGNRAWEYPLPTARTGFGSGTSPVVHAGLVLLNYDGQPRPVVYALNARDGSLKWKALLEPGKLAFLAGHATPAIWNGQVVIHGINCVIGLDLGDGSRRWSLITPTGGTATPVAHPSMLYVPGWSNLGDPSYFPPLPTWPEIVARYDKDQDGRLSKEEAPEDLFVMKRPELSDDIPGAHLSVRSAFGSLDRDRDAYIVEKEWQDALAMTPAVMNRHGLIAVRPGGEGDITLTHVAWKQSQNVPEVPSPVLYRDKLYVVANGGIVSCMDAKDGRVIFRGRVGATGEYYASPVAANGRLYLASRNGVLTVIQAGEELRVLAQNDLNEEVFASAAIVGDIIYIRTAAHIYAFKEAEKNK